MRRGSAQRASERQKTMRRTSRWNTGTPVCAKSTHLAKQRHHRRHVLREALEPHAHRLGPRPALDRRRQLLQRVVQRSAGVRRAPAGALHRGRDGGEAHLVGGAGALAAAHEEGAANQGRLVVLQQHHAQAVGQRQALEGGQAQGRQRGELGGRGRQVAHRVGGGHQRQRRRRRGRSRERRRRARHLQRQRGGGGGGGHALPERGRLRSAAGRREWRARRCRYGGRRRSPRLGWLGAPGKRAAGADRGGAGAVHCGRAPGGRAFRMRDQGSLERG
jgi:hypothetical protein